MSRKPRRNDFISVDEVVLALLGQSPGLHGVAIAERASALSKGRVQIPWGTLYPALKRLQERRLIAGTWESRGEATQQGRGQRRRFWHLTAEGRRAADEARGMLEALGRVIDPGDDRPVPGDPEPQEA